jgi:hypothetical protein
MGYFDVFDKYVIGREDVSFLADKQIKKGEQIDEDWYLYIDCRFGRISLNSKKDNIGYLFCYSGQFFNKVNNNKELKPLIIDSMGGSGEGAVTFNWKDVYRFIRAAKPRLKRFSLMSNEDKDKIRERLKGAKKEDGRH